MRYYTKLILSETLCKRASNSTTISFMEEINNFFKENPDIVVIDIQYIDRNQDPYALITYYKEEKSNRINENLRTSLNR